MSVHRCFLACMCLIINLLHFTCLWSNANLPLSECCGDLEAHNLCQRQCNCDILIIYFLMFLFVARTVLALWVNCDHTSLYKSIGRSCVSLIWREKRDYSFPLCIRKLFSIVRLLLVCSALLFGRLIVDGGVTQFVYCKRYIHCVSLSMTNIWGRPSGTAMS